MSNQSSAVAQMQSMSSTFREPGVGFWRSLFNAWIASYGNRIDPEGNVMVEL